MSWLAALMPATLLARAIWLLALASAVFGAGTYTGHQICQNRYDAARAESADAQLEQLRADLAAGERDAEALRAQLRELSTYQAALAQRSKDVPLVTVDRGACPRPPAAAVVRRAVPAARDPAAAAPGAAVAAAGPGAEVPGRDGPADAVDADPGLTLGAVSLWNSALVGRDLSAGACGAADPAAPPCAADAGLGVADAWANHAINAAACAADRARQQRLIDFLAARERQAVAR